jgi:hypothetical protein
MSRLYPDEEQEPLPTANFLASYFLSATEDLLPQFFCNDCSDADQTPRHHDQSNRAAEGGITSRITSTATIRRDGIINTAAVELVPPSMEAIRKRSNFYPPNNTFASLPSAADDHATPRGFMNMELSYSSYQTLPLAQDLTTCFLRDQLFSCDRAADKTPHHHDSSNHAGRDITTTSKRLEKNGELLPFPYDAGRSRITATRRRDGMNISSSTAALEPVPPPAMEAIARKFVEQESVDSSSKSIDGDSLFDLPESNLPVQSCSFANTHTTSPSPVIPWGDTIVGKKQDTPQQQEQIHLHEDSQHHQQIVFLRDVDTSTSRNNADTAPSNDNASLDADITSIIAPNKYRELVTGFTYAVMCQFVRAKLTQADQKKGSRTKTPLGHGGLKCKYCEGIGWQTGRYFPSSLKTFSDTMKTLLPMHRHLMVCSECPGEVKLLISSLHDHHEEELKVKQRRRGGQISFYRRMWSFIHPDDGSKKQQHQRSSRLKM